MRMRVKIRFAVLLLVMTSTAWAAAGRAPDPAASNVSEFEVNGLKVIVKQRPGSQTVVAGLFLRGGASNITAQNAGIESLMLAVQTDASVKFPRALQRTEVARMATTINSGVNYDYSALTMACLRVNFARSWEIFADDILHPQFAAEDVAQEKTRILTGLQERGDVPDSSLAVMESSAAFAGHAYANDPSGTTEAVSKLTAADLAAYHQKMMQTSRLLLVFVGDLNVADLRARVTAAFGSMPRGDYKSPPVFPLAFNRPGLQVSQRNLPTNYIEGIYAAPQFRSTDTDAMRIATSILRDRVFQQVRVRRNLSYAPDAFLRTYNAAIGGIYVTAVDANQAISVMLDEITRLKKEPVDPNVISATVAQYVTDYYLGNESSGAQAGMLAQYELIGGGWQNAETVLDRLRAVTPGDVQRVARQYMHDLQFIVVGSPTALSKQTVTAEP